MSFSRSLSGTAIMALAILAALPAEQKSIDESYDASGGITEGHAKQIEAITAQIKPILEAVPEIASVSGSVYGHANQDQSGTYGFSLSISASGSTEAVPAAVEEATSAASDEPAAATS